MATVILTLNQSGDIIDVKVDFGPHDSTPDAS